MQIVRRHLKQLDDADTAVLRALAVLGSGSPIAQIETLLPGGENGRLSALSAGGWVERLPDTDRFRYVNRITQDMVYSGMSPHERSVFHKRAGEYFYNTSLMGDRLFTTQAIAHYRLAGDSSGALEALDLAVREARSHNDEEAIIRLLLTGIAITSASPAASSKRTEFAERLGDIHARRGDYRKAASAYGESGVGQNALRLRGKLGLSLLVFDGVRSSHVLGKITRRVPLDFPGDLRWVLEAGHAWALSLAGSHYNAIRHVRDVLATLGSLSGYGAARTLMRAMLGMVLFYNGDLVDAQPHLDTARQSWEARADQQGVLLINRVLNEAPRSEVTDLLMQILLHPLLIDPMVE
ncbi:MAG: hypothetical protein ACFB51_21515 [Anaerolineae bacterium]